tara:strand:+ start:10257 stop:11216 length:960 start_codon:yes stop_codon:yes gene_type:complete
MISSTFIKEYILGKLGKNSRLASGGSELVIPSLFLENDWKMHMSINLDTGMFQCFKTKKKGNFVHLFAYLENISFKKSFDELSYRSFIHEDKGTEKEEIKAVPALDQLSGLEEIRINYPKGKITDLGMKAWGYLFQRKLFNEKEDTESYYVCHEGKYEGRTIFPFYAGNKMVFFQGRSMSVEQYPKYLNPTEVKASDIIVPFDLDRPSLYVTEGPTDMISLRLAGYNSTCTFGSVVSHAQADMLKSYYGRIIMAYDSDDAGDVGLERFERLRLKKRMEEFWTVSPPRGEDWNSLWLSGKLETLSPIRYDFEERVLRELA